MTDKDRDAFEKWRIARNYDADNNFIPFHKLSESEAAWQAARAESAKEIAEKDAEIERLRGLLWYSWYEMNAIRARDGSPEHVCPDYWNRIVDAFETALGEDCTPWPSEAAKKALAATKKED